MSLRPAPLMTAPVKPAPILRLVDPQPLGKRSIMFLRRHVGLGRDNLDGGRPPQRKSGYMTDYVLKDPLLIQVVGYWAAKKAGRFAPARSEIDPLDLAPALGWLSLLDVQRDPLRFRFRLHGTSLVETSRVEMTGRYVDEFPEPGFRELMLSSLAQVVETRAPWIGRRERVVDGERRAFEAIILPLSDDGQQVTMTLGGLRYL